MTIADIIPWLAVAIGGLLLVFGVVIAWRIVTGSIDISKLLNGETNEASTSRFQLLIFSFTVAFSYVIFLIAVLEGVKTGTPKMPDIPWSLLSLLGVSAATYAAGKKLDETPPKPDQPKG